MEIRKNYSLFERNTFGIRVNTNCFAEFDSVEELKSLLRTVESPVFCMGGGSNLLFLKDFPGTIIHSRIQSIDIVEESDSEVKIKVGSGVKWDEFVSFCVEHEFWGAENLSAIPGEVGASAVQNIGAYGVEAKDIIDTVETVSIDDFSNRTFSNNECEYDYRSSIFKTCLKCKYVVSYVTYILHKMSTPKLDYGLLKQTVEGLGGASLKNISEAVRTIRNSKLPDPKVLGNAGSFFKNPVITEQEFLKLKFKYPEIPSYAVSAGHIKVPAGWLIEKSGWKGRCMGPAAVHDKQALVLVNKGGAVGADIMRLADTIISDVKSQFGIMLETEVNYI